MEFRYTPDAAGFSVEMYSVAFMRTRGALVLLFVCTFSARPALGQTGTQELKRMNLRDVLDIEVTTLSRAPEQAIA